MKQEKVALVTGAAQGIGLAIAERFSEDGMIVILTDQSEEKLISETERLKEKGKKAACLVLDVSDEENVKNTFFHIEKMYGRLDILVNNAAISPKVNGQKREIVDTPLEEWERVLRINLTGTFLCVREALPLMVKNKWGRIINMASQAGRTFSRVAGSHYAASKSGIIGFTRTIAVEYGKKGITANCIAPGRVSTPMVNAVPYEKNEEFIKITPVGRLGQPEEVAAAVSFLCSEEAGYITGATLDINGGMFMN